MICRSDLHSPSGSRTCVRAWNWPGWLQPWNVTMPSCSSEVDTGSTTSASAWMVGFMKMSVATTNSLWRQASIHCIGCCVMHDEMKFELWMNKNSMGYGMLVRSVSSVQSGCVVLMMKSMAGYWSWPAMGMGLVSSSWTCMPTPLRPVEPPLSIVWPSLMPPGLSRFPQMAKMPQMAWQICRVLGFWSVFRPTLAVQGFWARQRAAL